MVVGYCWTRVHNSQQKMVVVLGRDFHFLSREPGELRKWRSWEVPTLTTKRPRITSSLGLGNREHQTPLGLQSARFRPRLWPWLMCVDSRVWDTIFLCSQNMFSLKHCKYLRVGSQAGLGGANGWICLKVGETHNQRTQRDTGMGLHMAPMAFGDIAHHGKNSGNVHRGPAALAKRTSPGSILHVNLAPKCSS